AEETGLPAGAPDRFDDTRSADRVALEQRPDVDVRQPLGRQVVRRLELVQLLGAGHTRLRLASRPLYPGGVPTAPFGFLLSAGPVGSVEIAGPSVRQGIDEDHDVQRALLPFNQLGARCRLAQRRISMAFSPPDDTSRRLATETRSNHATSVQRHDRMPDATCGVATMSRPSPDIRWWPPPLERAT